MNLKYYENDPSNYKKTFRDCLYRVVELMQIVDGAIIANNLPPADKIRVLFDLTSEISYEANQSYEAKFTSEKKQLDDIFLGTMTEKEIMYEMRHIFKDELAKVFPQADKTNG